ncbi:MAG TPA: NAD-dependent epimerase/dehydratase family protein, partial [Saprospiraceae bacterium]|nr:NAD-dependent epimerase/dehydratase family protein [Saprospiraceae bacterium]
MDKNQLILVTGGTGLLGSYLLRKLILDGYTNIRALKRPTSRFDLVADIHPSIEWVDCDVLDVIGLEEAMKGVAQVYHCAAIVSFHARGKRKMKQVNVEGTANVVNTALIEDVAKFVHVSSIAAIGRNEKHPIVTENLKWDNSSPFNTAYAKTKYLAEKEVWRGIAEGLDAVIINPSIILGSGYWQSGSTQIFHEIWKGLKFFPIGKTGFVDVRDVVQLMIQMMESNIVGERFIANGANLAFKDFFDKIAHTIQKPGPSIPVSETIRAIAWRLEWIKSKITGKSPMITKETAMISAQSFAFDNSKSKTTFGFQYRPIESTIHAIGTQLKEAAQHQFTPLTLG